MIEVMIVYRTKDNNVIMVTDTIHKSVHFMQDLAKHTHVTTSHIFRRSLPDCTHVVFARHLAADGR